MAHDLKGEKFDDSGEHLHDSTETKDLTGAFEDRYEHISMNIVDRVPLRT